LITDAKNERHINPMARFLSDKALMEHFGLSQRELDQFRLLKDFPKRDIIANKFGYFTGKGKGGKVYRYWSPQRAVNGAPKFLRNHSIPDDWDDFTALDFCQRMTMELKADLENMKSSLEYDGTIGTLVKLYTTKDGSHYKAVKESTRNQDYDPSLHLIESTVGNRAISALKGRDFKR
jgi:hypothetical protein